VRVVQLLPELNEGGVERGVVELSRELVKRGVESVVVSAGGRLASQIEDDGGSHIKFDVCSKNLLTVPSRIHHLRKLIKEIGPDILHARSRVPAWLTYLANRGQRPFVTTVHGFNSVNAYSRIMTRGDRVICVSGAIREYIQKHYQVTDDKITVIPRGIDLELFNPDHLDKTFVEQFRKEYQLDGRFIVTTVGRITQLKDYETFIRAIALLRRDIPHVCGLIVGGVHQDKSSYFSALKKLVAELKIEDLVRFTGSQKKIAEIYSLSDVVAICSKKPESFGRTAAEAVAMNVPVVATDHGGVLDIVSPGVTGFLFEPENVNMLVKNILLCQGLATYNFRSFVEARFSLQQMVDATYKVYQNQSSF